MWWPFKRKKKDVPTKSQYTDSVSKIGSRMIRVASMNFFGPYSESLNKKFLVGWSDSDSEQGIGGFRESGEGSYILAENGKVIVTGKLQRPNDGKVANNGTFIINDWMFGEGLCGTFYAFDKIGTNLIKYHFEANLYNNGISEDGKYAVCQCANSDTEDGGVLAFFDLEIGRILWKKSPESGWADSYLFDCQNHYLYLVYRDKGKFRYTFEGEFIDKDKWEDARIKYASSFELSLIARDRFKEVSDNLSNEEAEEILSLLSKSLNKGLDEYPNEKASVYRTIGEVHEALGKIDDAIKNYELALQINPKVGVKRRLNALKKKKA